MRATNPARHAEPKCPTFCWTAHDCLLRPGRLPSPIMNADIYNTAKNRTCLFLPQGMPFSSLPQTLLDELGSLQFWKTVELAPKMIAVDHKVVQADFQKQGYSIVSWKIDS